MLLFLCGSVYQLINCINIKVNLYPDVPADIVLEKCNDFHSIEQTIRDTKIFDEVINTEWGKPGERGDLGGNKEENTQIMLNAKDHPLALKNGKKYSDIFVYAINFSYTYLIYYQMIQEGIVPTVHLFEDGLSSYCEELLRIEHSNIDHSVFSPEKRIANNIKESLLYMPDWYCGAQKNFPKNILPRKADFAVIMPYLNMIFEKPELPKEKYIYFDEGCIQEGTNNNECGILDYISEIVGKENIIVKLHPRAPDNNDYFMRGYKTFKTGITPWELFLDLDGIDNKVIMAISSTCLFSDYSIYGKKINSIQFYNISLNHRIYINNHKPIVDAFFKKIYKDINSEQKQLFVPNSLAELECCIKYLEGEME